MCERIVWVEVNGVTKVSGGLLNALSRAFVPEVTLFQVESICISVICVAFRQMLSFFAAQTYPQVVGDFNRNLTLYSHQVGKFAIIRRAPQMSAIARIDELKDDRKHVAMLRNTSGQHGLHLKVLPYVSRIDVFSFVAKDRVTRHHL